MKPTLKHGYILYGLSFVVPNIGLDYIGVNLAIIAVLGGVGSLFESLWMLPLSIYGLSLFFLNFSLIPGAEIKKGWRKVFLVLPWSAAIIPEMRNDGGFYVYGLVPPYLLWASSITIINYLKIKEGYISKASETIGTGCADTPTDSSL